MVDNSYGVGSWCSLGYQGQDFSAYCLQPLRDSHPEICTTAFDREGYTQHGKAFRSVLKQAVQRFVFSRQPKTLNPKQPMGSVRQNPLQKNRHVQDSSSVNAPQRV